MANITKTGMTKNGQRLTTVPRAIAEAMRLEKGSKIEWIFDRSDVIVRKI
jgi:bifunctional DNA-binding transcriptional regulator/antitoxin component of YhaV-PrlF toxin-antitoxin module